MISLKRMFRAGRKRRKANRPQRNRPAGLRHDGAGRRGPSLVSSSVMIAVLLLSAGLSVTYRRPVPPIHYVVGQRAERYIYSETKFQYDDFDQTQKRRQQAASDVAPVYSISEIAVKSGTTGLLGLADALADYTESSADDSGASPKAPRSAMAARILANLAAEQLAALRELFSDNDRSNCFSGLVQRALTLGIAESVEVSELRLNRTSTNSITLASKLSEDRSRRISSVPVEELRGPEQAAAGIVSEYLARFPGNEDRLRPALAVVLAEVLKPTLVYDSAATDAAREDAASDVDTVRVLVPVNAVLLVPGQAITRDDIVRLESHQQALYRQPSRTRLLATRILNPVVCLVLLACTLYALKVVRPEVYESRSECILLVLVAVAQIGLSRVVMDLYALRSGSSFFLFSLLPMSFGGALLSPLVGMRAALCVAAFTTLVGAVQQNPAQAFELTLLGLISSLVAIAQMRRVTKRVQALLAGLGISLAVFATQLLFSLQRDLPGDVAWRVLVKFLAYAPVNSMGVALAVYACLPLLEYWFGLASQQSLLELSDLNHPLLKRLQLEAPGTFHHCHMVATLAEHAAQAIGANGMLARVSAYFHDIGKLAHPEYFIENSRGDNPHDELQPRMSSLIILNHVKEGIQLAAEYKLKPVIREAITQHHGTSIINFFYQKARERARDTDDTVVVQEQEYRYPGPRPRRREIALLSLADACEAAVRSLEKPTAGKIRTRVHEIVLGRIRDHQLDDAALTFAELSKAEESMIETLSMMFHGRVKYPKEYEDEAGLEQAPSKSGLDQQDEDDEGPAIGGDAERT